MIDAALTLKAYKKKGWFEVLRDGNRKVSGFWLGHPLSPEREQSFVKAAAVSEDLDQDTFIPISFGDYRIVPNDHEIKGGHFVMIGTARAPTESVLPLGSFRWRKGDLNPASKQVARFRYGNVLSGVKFLCPTCLLPNSCSDSSIDEVVGVLVKCPHCVNVSHIPAAYKTHVNISSLAVRGGIIVPIAEFGDWFFAHPCYSSADVELYGSHGLWGFCAGCHHLYASTVLAMLPSFDLFKGVTFNAKSNESARDFNALRNHHCPDCGQSRRGYSQAIRGSWGEVLCYGRRRAARSSLHSYQW
jgi:hypothetical protein